ncbi:hypothetical protein FACS1894145_0440 [Bacteroidia bacterium]|nr:hypothetical protein FACS1894145_0440 [Bacteroidia bacterium]
MVDQLLSQLSISYIYESADAIAATNSVWLMQAWETARLKMKASGTKVKRLKIDYDEKATELETLRKQKNNITGRVAEIRQEILQVTGATETEIPFVGELLQIKNNAKNKWEFAIEKVLYRFALQLIVPERFYHQVNQYVNDNNLKGRIVYQRIKEENFLNQFDIRNLLSFRTLNTRRKV